MSDGRVVQLEIDSATMMNGHTRSHVDAVQSAVSNYLSDIGQTGECLKRVKRDSEAKDFILEQLAIAGSLLHCTSGSLIECSVVVTSDQFSTRIIVSLSNKSRFTLGHNWTFLVSVSSSSKCCGCDPQIGGSKSCSVDSCSSYASRDVSGLAPGASASLPLVVQLDQPSSVSYIIEMVLVYTPKNQIDASMKQISIPLATKVLDILDFVRLSSSSNAECLHSQQSCFASECRKLQQWSRPQSSDDTNSSVSRHDLEFKKRVIASVKEHVISLYASKSSCIPGTELMLSYYFLAL